MVNNFGSHGSQGVANFNCVLINCGSLLVGESFRHRGQPRLGLAVDRILDGAGRLSYLMPLLIHTGRGRDPVISALTHADRNFSGGRQEGGVPTCREPASDGHRRSGI